MIKTVLRGIFGLILVLGIMFFLAYSETHYSRTGIVISKGDGYTYVFKDGTGNSWEFYSDTIIPVNANIKAKFFNNNTMDDIKDDILINYEIIGYADKININF